MDDEEGVHCRTFSGNPDFYPLDASNAPSVLMTKNVSKYGKMSLGGRGQNQPTGNHCYSKKPFCTGVSLNHFLSQYSPKCGEKEDWT